MSFELTQDLIGLVLSGDAVDCRTRLYERLRRLQTSEAEFYVGIVEHAPFLHLTSQQWYELLSRLPSRMLRSQIELKKFLSVEQISRLPPERG